jgi:hypothetical protein
MHVKRPTKAYADVYVLAQSMICVAVLPQAWAGGRPGCRYKSTLLTGTKVLAYWNKITSLLDG